jgi:hypothetical protein
MGQKIIGYILALLVQYPDGAIKINSVPQGHSGNDQIESTRAASLTLLGSVPQLAQPVEENRSG